MIELKNISRIYKPRRSEAVRALDNVSLTFGEKGMVFILGKSGSGKSTLLNVIGGLDKYNEGELLIKGKSTKSFKQSDFDSYRNTMIGFVFQDYNVLDEFSVAQNIGLALELQGRKATSESIDKILNEVDLEGYAKRKPNQLSGGQKQRVAIARALVKDPEIIMADEPTGALDSNTGRQVFETLKKLSEKRLVIVVSHDRDFAERYGSRIIEFKDGKIISDVSKIDVENNDLNNINYEDDKILINQGYILTDEDVKIINQYLQTQTLDTSIERKLSGHTFTNTDSHDIIVSRGEYRPIKSKLPFGTSLKIGAQALKHKTVRLVFAIILASLSFAMFGLTDTMSSYDKVVTTINSVEDSNINYAALTKNQVIEDDGYTYIDELKFNDNDLVILNHEYPNLNFKPIYSPGRYNELYFHDHLFKNIPAEYQNLHRPAFSGYFELSTNDINLYNMTLFGNLPSSDDEIVISKYNFDLFKEYNFKDENNVEIQINNYNDLIGKKITVDYYNKLTIVGVVDTNFVIDRYLKLTEKTDNYIMFMLLSEEYNDVRTRSIHNLIFVNEGYITRNKQNNGFDLDEIYRFGYRADLLIEETEYYFQYINNINNINLNDIIFLNGKTKNTMTKYDVVVSSRFMNWLIQENYIEHHQFLQNHIMAYIESIPSNKKVELLQIYNPSFNDYDGLDEYGKENARYEIYNYFYYSKEAYSGNITKTSEELYDEADLLFIETLSNTNLHFRKTIYGMIETEDLQKINIVGFLKGDPYDYSQPDVLVISNEYYDEFGFGDVGIYSSVISSINENDKINIKKLVEEHYKTGGVVYMYKNPVTTILGSVNSFVEGLAEVFLYIGIAFAIFSSLLLLNFISTSVSYKKKEIGILRAIGARGKDVLGIFTKESTIIALINFALALTGVIFATIFINNKIRNDYDVLITLLKPGIRQVVLMLGVSLLVGFISSAIPVIRISRKRPIDAIRDN